jgi:(1->4)-alpha-D-glucan 1-alpha-D-glucosylmutase
MHIPKSTYRLQFNAEFKFKDAKEIISYLSLLGISDVYASPVFKAKKGSRHGYDTIEHNQLNPELGDEADFNELIDEVKKYNLGWLQDFVPNHMAYNYQNRMLADLLENGDHSTYYDFFDIDWNHNHPGLEDRLLAPFLGKFYESALSDGEIKLSYNEDGFSFNYYETKLPVRLSTYRDILSINLDELKNKLNRNDGDLIKFQGLLNAIKSLYYSGEPDEIYNQIKFIKGTLWELYDKKPEIKDFINEALKCFNGSPSDQGGYKLLDDLHSKQNFRLSFWKAANEKINYRRFFNVNELISLKMENINTFKRTHSLILKLIQEDKINGIRIDHIDGLYNPKEYLQRLRKRAENIYIVVEKILDLKENLPHNWQIEGTSGYDFLNYVNGIFCKSSEEKHFNTIYRHILKNDRNYKEMVFTSKRMMVKNSFTGEVEKLALAIESISGKDRYGNDFTLNRLKSALEEILIYFPVYRTYITGDNISSSDKKYIDKSFAEAEENNPHLANEFGYIKNLLLLKFKDYFTEQQKESAIDFIMKFQQLTSPVMAKGFEDTTLYNFNRLISLNEVGSRPDKFGISRKEFHKFNKERQRKWPHTLNATSTHDTKRGEDVRARINVLSEIPVEWKNKLNTWISINKELKRSISKNNYPSDNDEYFLYQTLLGSYPFNEAEHETYIQRIKEYLIKSVREAQVNSSWDVPNNEYESAYTLFAEKILERNNNNNFLKDFLPFQKKIAYYGVFNSLAQVIIKIASPGIPDFYQGTELWDLSLVDPDNRHPVDYKLRKKILNKIINQKMELDEYLNFFFPDAANGKVKLFTIYKALSERKNNIDLFQKGSYLRLDPKGKKKTNVFAFARNYGNKWIVAVVPRYVSELVKKTEIPVGQKVWQDTYIEVPSEKLKFRNIFTDEIMEERNKIFIHDAFRKFPAALLISL